MAVLLEGYSIVFDNEVLEEKYPGGVVGLRADWNNGSWCSDGALSRIAYFDAEDIYCCMMGLLDKGLACQNKFAEDFAVYYPSGRPALPCLWADVEESLEGLPICYLIEEKIGKIAVPEYYQRNISLAHYSNQGEKEIKATLSRISHQGSYALYQDALSSKTFRGPAAIVRH